MFSFITFFARTLHLHTNQPDITIEPAPQNATEKPAKTQVESVKPEKIVVVPEIRTEPVEIVEPKKPALPTVQPPKVRREMKFLWKKNSALSTANNCHYIVPPVCLLYCFALLATHKSTIVALIARPIVFSHQGKNVSDTCMNK